MRKRQQKQILELLQTIKEAQSAGLYADCQEGALSLGAFVESVEGADNPRIAGTIALLAEYCELLYGAHKGEIGEKRLRKQLVGIENSVKNELAPTGMEIAFLPYKASMWDSMESVWLAAKEDPVCEAYVIPVPYYDRLPGGAFGSMHCESGEYPAYVPVVDWREYDFEERRPDAIFTHNPYDDGNLVTSIHPDFYCKRLKDFTELLVYVPYFVTSDDVETHFCVCAGTLYADTAVMQSEKVRRTYIRVFREFEKKQGCKNGFGKPEDKFRTLGSPKFDRVINARREDHEIPKEWKHRLERPDGSRRKVILYNTNIIGLLAANERALSKLRYVFDLFRGRDDTVLLWRPHPLNRETYAAMRRELLEAYLEIVRTYKREGFGLYDDGASPNRAIAISDAYYGDWSSLVAQYHCTGKPIMIQNFEITENGFNNAESKESAIGSGFVPPGKNILHRDADACKTQFDCYLYENASQGPGDLADALQSDEGAHMRTMREKQIEMCKLFMANADGTSGLAIFSDCKRRILGC